MDGYVALAEIKNDPRPSPEKYRVAGLRAAGSVISGYRARRN
jgi:hypothetical protein